MTFVTPPLFLALLPLMIAPFFFANKRLAQERALFRLCDGLILVPSESLRPMRTLFFPLFLPRPSHPFPPFYRFSFNFSLLPPVVFFPPKRTVNSLCGRLFLFFPSF